MTDNLDRIFVSIVYDSKVTKPKIVADEIQRRMEGIEFDFKITPDKPPPILSRKEIEDRFVNLYMAAQIYQRGYVEKFGVEIQIDPRLLYISTVSAFDDIERYKAYHLEKPYRDRSDAVKRSAYVTKWLAKTGVFQTRFDLEAATVAEVLQDPSRLDSKPALANISFAIKLSMAYLRDDCPTQPRMSLTPDAEFQLSYDLLYRRVNEDALLATYQKLMNQINGKDIMVKI